MTWKLVIGPLFPLAAIAMWLGVYWPWSDQGDLCLPGVVEIYELRLASKLGGRVARVHVDEGDTVAAGTLLVEFETPELQAQRTQWTARLAAAEAELQKAVSGARPEEIAAAQAVLDGAEARLSRLTAEPRQEERAHAESALQSAQSELEFAQDNFQRGERLYGDRSISLTEFELRRRRYEMARAQQAAARAQLDLLNAGAHPDDIGQAAAELRRAKAEFRAVESGTRSEDLEAARARVAELKARIHELEVYQAEGRITAPTGGMIEVLSVRRGDVVAPNQAAIRLLSAEDLWVRVYVPETELGHLRVEQVVKVSVDSFPDRQFDGRIVQISAHSEFTPRNIQSVNERRHQVFGVKIRVENSSGTFKSGMAARVCFPRVPE